MSTEESKIIRIIRKLFALGDKSRNSNEKEAETAMAKANELLIRHNLSMDEITESSESLVVKDSVEFKSKFAWKKILANNVAHYNFCNCLMSVRRGNGRLYFIGRKDNVAATKVMYDWFILQVNFLLIAAMKEIDDIDEGYPYGKLIFISSFCLGVVERLGYRLQELRERMEEKTKKATPRNSCTDLVIRTGQENVKFIEENFGKTRNVKMKHNSDPIARAMGNSAADQIRLNKEISRTGARGR